MKHIMKFKSKKGKRNGLTPREKQIRFRARMKKVGCVLATYFFVGIMGYSSVSNCNAKVEANDNEDLHLIDMSEVESFIVNGNDLYLNFKDGTGYYLESTQIDTHGVPTETTRTEEGILVGMENGNYILQTEDGHLWEISDAPEVFYKVTFDTNGTDDVKDDEIVGLE